MAVSASPPATTLDDPGSLMASRTNHSATRAVIGAIAGVVLAAVLPLGGAAPAGPTTDGATRPAPPAAPASPSSPAPRSSTQTEGAPGASETSGGPAQDRRLRFLRTWGRPPLPASPARPTEAEVRAFLEGITDDEVLTVDCYAHPCVAALRGWEPDVDFADRLRERWPHAKILGGTNTFSRDGVEATAFMTQVALLDAPIEVPGPEWIFVYRLMQAVHHRVSDRNFDLLQQLAAEKGAAP